MSASKSNNCSDDGDLSIFGAAKRRWLNVEEIISLLDQSGTDEYGQSQCILELATGPPPSPPDSGTLILYDRLAVRDYKVDGYEWIRKRSNPKKIREDHVKLRYMGQYRVGGNYVHSAETPTLHRRAYRLLDTEEEKEMQKEQAGKQALVLVHYLDTDEATNMSANKTSSNGQQSTKRNHEIPVHIHNPSEVVSKRVRTASTYAQVLEMSGSSSSSIDHKIKPHGI